MHAKVSIALLAGLVAGASACALEVEQPTGSVQQEERYTPQDDPHIFTSDLETRLSQLPREGAADAKPWAGNYWPTFQDNINYRWAGSNTPSPAAKYGQAFGRSGVEDAVSRYYGIDRYSSRTACTSDSQCNRAMAESCAKRSGESSGYCIPTWWGICHAWAPLAVLRAEPKYPVTHNGVTFQVQDLKALLTLAYDRTTSRFVSLRCNENDDAGEIEYDGYERPTGSDVECRDTNPATLHILLANYLGLRGESFVYDRTFDYQVWNQPIRDFEVTGSREVTAQEAHRLLGVRPTGGTVEEANGALTRGEWYHHAPIAVSGGEDISVVMQGTEDADLYVRFGAQATTSAYDCRPYRDGSSESCQETVPVGQTQMFVSVRGYASSVSQFDLTITYGAEMPGEYVFNDDAARLYYVETTVGYITESEAWRDGPLGDDTRFRREDRYQYILEEDAAGELIGGEWIGASKRRHPDFVWLPTGRRNVAIAGGAISFAEIEMLYQQSIDPGDPNDDDDDERTYVSESGTVTRGQWQHYGPFTAGTDLNAIMTGNGDADLYVRVGARPTSTAYDCRPYSGGSNETCQVGAGEIYVSVNGYDPSSSFQLEIDYR